MSTLRVTTNRRQQGSLRTLLAVLLLASLMQTALSACATVPQAEAATTGAADQSPPAPLTELQGLPVQDPDAQAALALQRYAAMPPVKAAAVALDLDGRWAAGAGWQAADQLSAVRTALGNCEEARQREAVSAPCELLHLNDEAQELGRALRQRVRADQPDTPALLWQFTNGDAVLYLAGSMHAQRATALPLAAALEDAYAKSSTLIVEIDLESLTIDQRLATARQFSLLPDGRKLAQELTPEQLRSLRAAAAELGVPWAQLDALYVGTAVSYLAVAALTTAGFQTEQGVEALLLQRAHQDRKTVHSLETYEQQAQLLASAPAALSTAGLDATLTGAAMRHQLRRLYDAWMSADLAAVAQLFDTANTNSGDGADENRAWTRRLLDERNHAMAAHVRDRLNAGAGTALMVVGAGHLAGEQGIIAMLQRDGFTGVQLTRGGTAHPPPTAAGPTLPATPAPAPDA